MSLVQRISCCKSCGRGCFEDGAALNGSLRQMSLVPVSGEGKSLAWSYAWVSEHRLWSAEDSVPGVAALGEVCC